MPEIRLEHINKRWGKFYAVVLGFFTLIVSQAVFPVMSPMTGKEIVVFLLTMLCCLVMTQ